MNSCKTNILVGFPEFAALLDAITFVEKNGGNADLIGPVKGKNLIKGAIGGGDLMLLKALGFCKTHIGKALRRIKMKKELQGRWNTEKSQQVWTLAKKVLYRGWESSIEELEKLELALGGLPLSSELEDTMDLRGLVLDGETLDSLSLSYSSLQFLKWQNIKLVGGVYTATRFQDGEIKSSHFENTSLQSSYWENILVEDCSFENANLTAMMFNAQMVNCKFQSCHLIPVVQLNSSYQGCEFVDSKIIITAWRESQRKEKMGKNSMHYLHLKDCIFRNCVVTIDAMPDTLDLSGTSFPNSKVEIVTRKWNPIEP